MYAAVLQRYLQQLALTSGILRGRENNNKVDVIGSIWHHPGYLPPGTMLPLHLIIILTPCLQLSLMISSVFRFHSFDFLTPNGLLIALPTFFAYQRASRPLWHHNSNLMLIGHHCYSLDSLTTQSCLISTPLPPPMLRPPDHQLLKYETSSFTGNKNSARFEIC